MGESSVTQFGFLPSVLKLLQNHKGKMGVLLFYQSPFPPQLSLYWLGDFGRFPKDGGEGSGVGNTGCLTLGGQLCDWGWDF